MSAELQKWPEIQGQKSETQLTPEQKVSQYQKLANDSLQKFYQSVRSLVSWSDWQKLQQAAYNRVTEMNNEIQTHLDSYNNSWENWKKVYEKMIDSTISSNKQSLIKLWSATKESLDDLINTWIRDFTWKNTLKISQTSQILDEIMKKPQVSDVQTRLADSANNNSPSPQKTAGLWTYASWMNLDQRMKDAGL